MPSLPPAVFYRRLADAVLVLHFGVVLFVVGGLITVVAGNRLNWRWVNQRWFRLVHLAAIGVVVVQAWFGQACPLTTLEPWLRMRSGALAAEAHLLRAVRLGIHGGLHSVRAAGGAGLVALSATA